MATQHAHAHTPHDEDPAYEAPHHHPNYVRVYVFLLVLLGVSIVGPEFGIRWVTLVTAFGDAWKFISSGSRTGNFSSVNITAPSGLTASDFTVNYLSDGVEIVRSTGAGVTYDSWKEDYWPSPDANDDWNDDPDFDGMLNLTEYALGLDPLTPDADDPAAPPRSFASFERKYERHR